MKAVERCCRNCKYRERIEPCVNCFRGSQFVERAADTPEETNHPKRYAGGAYECIDVMLDVFGKEAVKNFCKLNAFKYIWREKQKNGFEDIKKAVWYLNKFIELSEDANENV